MGWKLVARGPRGGAQGKETLVKETTIMMLRMAELDDSKHKDNDNDNAYATGEAVVVEPMQSMQSLLTGRTRKRG